MPAGIKANPDGSAAIQVGGTDVITLTSGGAATFVTSPTTVQAGTAAAPSITTSGDTNTGIFFPAADTIAFAEGGAEVARFDSAGNFGVGTSTPARKLHVAAAGTSYVARFETTTDGLAVVNFKGNATGDFTVGAGANGENLVLLTNTTERLRIDSSGNVGIGTSLPSSSSIVRFLQVDNATSSGLVLNAVRKYSIYSSSSGTLSFLDETAGAEQMRIDAFGYTQFSRNLVMPYQGAPTSKAAAATLTGAELVTGILNTTGTTYTITLPTGTNIEGALTWAGNNVCLDFFVINTASGTITIGANGNTTLGGLTIATGTSAHFRIRRTAVNTFTVYRL